MIEENNSAKENKKPEDAKQHKAADSKAPVKKKKIIIVSGNNRNKNSGHRNSYSSDGNGSYGGGRRSRQGGPRRNDNGSGNGRGRRSGGGNRTESGRPAQHRIIRPTIKPVQMEVDYHKPTQQQEAAAERRAAEASQKAEDKFFNAARPQKEEVPKNTAEVAEKAAAAEKAPAASAAPAAAPEVKEAAMEKTPSAAPEVKKQPEAASVKESSAPAAEVKKAPEQKTEPSAGAAETSRNQSQGRGTGSSSRPAREAAGRSSRGGQSGQGAGGRARTGQGGRSADRTGRGSSGSRGGQSAGGNGRGGRDSRDARGSRGGRGSFGARPGQGASFGGRTGGQNAGGRNTDRNRRGGRPGEGGFSRDAEKHRDENKRKQNKTRDQRSRKDQIYSEDDNRKGRPGRFIKPVKKAEEKVEEKIKTISLPEKVTVRELADRMHINPSEIIKKQFLAGNVLTPNSELSYEDAENIALEYDILCEKEEKVDTIQELLKEDEDDPKDLVPRPPVICVMGHVDHGKTSLLDYIRKTSVTSKEAGGITQAIGAYTVDVKGRSITFLDTPGHEAFTAMRMRGANATDIAVLVVAADDGVMPQTIEAINHAKAAGVEIIVAVNKMDKPNANLERVKQELTEYGLVATDWGGSTEFVPVSAKTGQGIPELLDTILLTADIMELKANPNRLARGIVLEAKLDKGRGPVANVLIQKGTLHVGDFISAGASFGKVRAMVNDKGRRVKEATPSQPVEILGLSDVPGAGEIIVAHETNDEAKQYAETYKNQHKEELLEDTRMHMNLDDLFSQMKEGKLKEFDLIVKADVQGSAEALKSSLLKLSNDEVVVKVIHSGVGAITESDVSLASASNAVIIGFNVRPDATAKSMAEHEGVDIRLYKVIYQAIDAVKAALQGMLAPVYEEQVIGHVEVRQLFKASSVGNIAGSYVKDGVIRRGCRCRIYRGEEMIYEGKLASLKRFKDDVKEVKAGFECGLVFDGFDKMQVGDMVEAYDLVEVPRK